MSEVSHAPEHVNLYVLSPEEIIYEGRVLWVQAPLTDGLIGIWPGHAPLIASLKEGHIRFDTDRGVEQVAVRSGILRVGVERCVILVGSLASTHETPGVGTEALVAEFEQVLSETLPEDQIQELQRY